MIDPDAYVLWGIGLNTLGSILIATDLLQRARIHQLLDGLQSWFRGFFDAVCRGCQKLLTTFKENLAGRKRKDKLAGSGNSERPARSELDLMQNIAALVAGTSLSVAIYLVSYLVFFSNTSVPLVGSMRGLKDSALGPLGSAVVFVLGASLVVAVGLILIYGVTAGIAFAIFPDEESTIDRGGEVVGFTVFYMIFGPLWVFLGFIALVALVLMIPTWVGRESFKVKELLWNLLLITGIVLFLVGNLFQFAAAANWVLPFPEL